MPRNRRNGSGSREVPHNVRHETKRYFTGVAPRGRSDPPRVIINPWNQAVVVAEIVGGSTLSNQCISIDQLHKQFSASAGIETSNNLEYRIVMAQAWHLVPNGELNNHVRIRFYSLENSAISCNTLGLVLSQQEDFGTPARNATCKFIWPSSHSSNTFESSNTNIIYRLTLEPSQQILTHVHILWRFQGPAATKMVDGEIMRNKIDELFNARDLASDFECLNV